MAKQTTNRDELLPLSGIQHFIFCRRQWALIHIEQQWKENVLTTEGKLLHKQVDDPTFTEVRKGVIISRAIPIASYSLGLSGICDVVEFHESPEGVMLPGRTGTYLPVPVEYKRGHEKTTPMDEAQLCAQAICLEEMLSVNISSGWLFYHEIRRRVQVNLTAELRNIVYKMSDEMHSYFERGYTPRVKVSKACQSCSLVEICLPVLQENVMEASKYIQEQLKKD